MMNDYGGCDGMCNAYMYRKLFNCSSKGSESAKHTRPGVFHIFKAAVSRARGRASKRQRLRAREIETEDGSKRERGKVRRSETEMWRKISIYSHGSKVDGTK